MQGILSGKTPAGTRFNAQVCSADSVATNSDSSVTAYAMRFPMQPLSGASNVQMMAGYCEPCASRADSCLHSGPTLPSQGKAAVALGSVGQALGRLLVRVCWLCTHAS